MRIFKTAAFAAIFLALTSCMDRSVSPAVKTDPAIEKRIGKLLAGMTLEEKVGQMTQLTIGVMMDNERTHLIPELVDSVFGKYKVGSILNVIGNASPSKEVYAEVIRELQEKSMELIGIPCLYGLDQIHGASYIDGATFFPQEINQAATFDRNFAFEAGRVCAYETRAAMVPWTFAPVMDLGRNPLWPRMWESYGEDTYLNAEMGKASVAGLQGDCPSDVDSLHIAACLKHYMAYGVPQTGQDRTPSYVNEAEMREKYFEPFKQCIRAGALSVMVNSSSNNGVPFHCNREFLTVWLKENLNWDGVIVTDWNDINNLYERDRIAVSEKDAVRLAVNAGIDMSMVPSNWRFCRHLKELVEEGAVPMSRIDDAVRRILRMKFRLGLFDHPVWDVSDYGDFASSGSAATAYRAAVESEVLLKNNGVLPIPEGSRILLCGPNANSMRCLNGGWSYTWQGELTDEFASEYNTIFEALGKRFVVQYVPGVVYAPANGDNWKEEIVLGLDAVTRAARSADIVVACVGENSYCETPGNDYSLQLSDNQKKLVRAAALSGKPVVLVIGGGRPRIVNDIEPLADAVIGLMLPGNYGGDALASLLAGDENFSGKLPFTWPAHQGGHSPYDYKVSENVATMEGEYNYDAKMDVQWEFGHGLSYTRYEYSDFRADRTVFTADDSLHFSVRVRNAGEVEGRESVLLYTSDLYAASVPDVKRLRAFTKISLAPGEETCVTLSVRGSDLAYVGPDGKWRLDAGDFLVRCGGESLRIECSEDKVWEEPDILSE